MRYTQRVFLICILGIGAILFLSRCGDDDGGQGGGQGPAKPTLGANEAFQTNGSTDDGDDTNGAATRYPPARTSADNLTTATSTPTTYRDLALALHAEPGANPARVALAFGNTKATSTFTVADTIRCYLRIRSNPTVTLDSGLADYLVVARVQSVAGADVQAKYDFTQSSTNPAILDIKRWGQPDSTMANGGTTQRTDSTSTFELLPGTYTLEFEITGNAKADTKADLNVTAQVDLL